MSQQEFEPRQHRADKDLYQLQYPYAWSEQDQREGMPRDESPSSYSTQDGRYEASNATQVPWWVRPQPQRLSPLTFVTIVLIVIFLTFMLGELGVIVISFPHLPVVILSVISILFIFFLLLFVLLVNWVIRVCRN